MVKTLRVGVYAVAFVPLIIFPGFLSPFHFGKVVVFRSLVEIMALIYVLLAWQDRTYLPRANPILWGTLAFTLAFTLTTITSINSYLSFWGTLERMGGLWTFWHYFAFFVIATAVLRTRAEWRMLLRITVMNGILSSVYGILQRTDWQFIIGAGTDRIFGTMGNAALFAGFEIVCLFLALTLYADRLANVARGRTTPTGKPGHIWTVIGTSTAVLSYLLFWKMAFTYREDPTLEVLFIASPFLFLMVWGICKTITAGEESSWLPMAVVLDFVAILLTAVRGTFLALAVGLGLFIALLYVQYRLPLAKKALIGLLAVSAMFLIVLLTPIRHADFFRQSAIMSRVLDTSVESYSLQTRLLAWQAGIQSWKDSAKTVLLGWGPEAFNIPFSRHFDPSILNEVTAQTFYDRAHNMFVEILVTMGLFGLTAYLFLFYASFKSLLEIRRRSGDECFGLGLCSLLVAYTIHNFFIFDSPANFIVFFVTIGFTSFLMAPERQPSLSNSVPWAAFRVPTAVVMSALVVLSIWNTNVLQSLANDASARAEIMAQRGDFRGAAQAHLQAIAYDVPGKYEYRHRFAQFRLESPSTEKMTPESSQMVIRAIAEVQKNAEDNPHDYLPLMHLSHLNILLGKDDPLSPYNDEALRTSLAAVKISPTFARAYYGAAQAYLNKKDYAHAVEYFRQAARLSPSVGLSYWYWGMTEIERGNAREGLRLIDESFAKGNVLSEGDSLRLATVYQKLGETKRLVGLYETLTKQMPEKGQYHATLAVTYAKVGQGDKAIAEAKWAAQLDPKLEPDARKFVAQIGGQWK